MKLGLNIGYWGSAMGSDASLVTEAESLGYDSVWAAEAYGSDVVTVLSWLGAKTSKIKLGTGILQMPARTPAMTAMTVATLDQLSNGRVLMGLGLSGPQVVEGWHGRPYGKPLGKTREYVSIVRTILAREAPLEHQGDHYQIPYNGPGATGLGKPLKLISYPLRADVPLYLAAIGPKNVALTAELADGWLPVFYSPQQADEVWGEDVKAGLAKSGNPDKAFDVSPTVSAMVTDDIQQARDSIKPSVALYVGGMGAKGKNFYNDLACRYGYEEHATKIQDLYLEGNRAEAIAMVPDALIDELNLIGTKEQIADRLEAWKESGVGTLQISSTDKNTLRVLAELVL